MKPFTSIDEQISILSDRGMLFENEEAARKQLMYYGYYEIVNGYNKFLLGTGDRFKENEKFEHLFSIYRLDHKLQNTVLQSTLEVECSLKTAMAYYIAEAYGHDQIDYLRRTNYKSGNKLVRYKGQPQTDRDGKQLFEIDTAFKKFTKILKDDLQPFKHYREDHGHIPPWILFKGCTFGNMKHFYRLQKEEIKDSIIRTMLGLQNTKMIELTEGVKSIFAEALLVSQKFRNRAAHLGRILGFKIDNEHLKFSTHIEKTLHVTKEQFDMGYGKGDYYSLLAYFKLLDNRMPYIFLTAGTRHVLTEHFKLYPGDRELILDSLGVPPTLHSRDVYEIFI